MKRRKERDKVQKPGDRELVPEISKETKRASRSRRLIDILLPIVLVVLPPWLFFAQSSQRGEGLRGGWQTWEGELSWEAFIGEAPAEIRASAMATQDHAAVLDTLSLEEIISNPVLSHLRYEDSRCDFERVPVRKMTPALFRRRYYLRSPVIIEQGTKNWPATQNWRLSTLLERYGELMVKVGESPKILHNEGDGVKSMRLRDFLRLQRLHTTLNETEFDPDQLLYVFDRDAAFRSFDQDHFLLNDIEWPRWLDGIVSPHSYSFYFILGENRSGVPWHLHSDGFNALIYGRKHWMFYMSRNVTPPGYPSAGNKGHDAWLRDTLPTITPETRPLQCVQQPGDILYVPEGWYHATYSMGDVVGMAVQATEAQTAGLKCLHESFDIMLEGLRGFSGEFTDDAPYWFTRGLELMEQGIALVPSEAFRAYEAAARAAINIPGQLKMAETLIRQSIELHQAYPESLLVLGHVKLVQGKPQLAIEPLLSAINVNPGYAEAHHKLSQALTMLGNSTGASYHQRMAAKLEPKSYGRQRSR
mmetsp:Transcript_28074/g.38452  ORF Transcript_28074/g.38452 Transcript_28074/m.38452 type:complete len:531 (-) Transcript_28074:264-1856(-)|eukprot:CAMPEP_0185753460 /NCGR_PEP_ID=MMETSP1174-20130828/12189_1 /TAXON_ID=35687 /ORGANISM="Dictyocha speculum, Strain CCMP1381" /LENGTH=530 /DNA_ID=CAMNT_0028431317 /DNA_START=86 /DNA_END=1678 /DNA_ORIENTATION=+